MSEKYADEDSLTGEGEPQVKAISTCVMDTKSTIFDMPNVLFTGTNVISGSGFAIVCATGSGKYRPNSSTYDR